MKEKSNRPPLQRRPFVLRDEGVRERLIAAIKHLPIDPIRPLLVVIQEEQTKRADAQNSLYWAMLNDIASQAWIEQRQYSAEVLHEYLKRSLLPEDEPPPEPGEVRDGYRKWRYDPAGERILVGSTTMLTVRGMANYITGVEVFGAGFGVQFTARGEG